MRWIDTTTHEEAEKRSFAIWNRDWTKLANGTLTTEPMTTLNEGQDFWYDALKKVRDDPAKRYEIAVRHLPLPAAWREIALSLRAIIREARKAGTPYHDELRELHKWAAMWSFGVIDDATKGTGYGLLEMTSFAMVSSLDLAWGVIGCDELVLLNGTDRKWMREAWGEPKNHTCARILYRDEYLREDARARAGHARNREAEQARIMDWADGLEDEDEPKVASAAKPTIWQRLFGRT